MDANRTEMDKFLQSYAILGKNVLLEGPTIKIYQIERFALTKKYGAKVLKSGAKAFFKSQVGKEILSQAKNIGLKAIKGLVAFSAVATGGVAIMIAIAIIAAIAIIDKKKTEESMEQKFKKVLIKEELDKIQSFFEAYNTCFSNADKLEAYFKKLGVGKQKYSENVNQIQELLKNKNYLYKKIMAKDQTSLPMRFRQLQLYYRLQKSIFEILAIAWNGQIQDFVKKSKVSHSKMKQKVTNQIRRYIEHNKKGSARVVSIKGRESISFLDENNLCNENNFAEEIYNQIFRCPLTGATIDEIYNVQTWLSKADQSAFDAASKTSGSFFYKYLGVPQQHYQTHFSCPGHKIRKMGPINNGWACYYENLVNKSGTHDPNFNGVNDHISLDKDRVIFLNNQGRYTVSVLPGGRNICSCKQTPSGKDVEYCLELQPNQIVVELASSGLNNLRFKIQYINEAFVNKKVSKSYFNGYIALKDDSQRVGFGCKNKYKFIFTKGYNFHSTDTKDQSQRLIFEAVNPSEYFDNEDGQIKKFTCRITNQEDRTMYMVRDNRDQTSSDFGNNNAGGQTIEIQLHKKLGKNQYEGSMSVIGCQIYLSGSNNLKWTQKQWKNERTTIFRIHLNQI